MFSSRFRWGRWAALLVLAGGATAAHAQQTLNIDFGVTGSGGYTGTAAAPDAGTFFNPILTNGGSTSFTSSGSLLYSDGVTPSGITVAGGQASSFLAGGGFIANPTALMGDYLYVTTNSSVASADVTLTGLTAGATYNLYLYGAGDSAGQATRFTVNGIVQATTGPLNTTANILLGEDYVLYTGVAPTAGSLTINYATVSAGGGQFAAFNGLQLQQVPVAVPEPGTLALAGLALPVLGLIARRRRA